MAKQRMINTRFWSDTYISELDTIEKLLFIYFLTNQYTNLSGIYELSLKHIALDTGIDKQEMLPKIIKRFSDAGKIYYIDGWIYIKNFQKYQNSENPKIKKGIDREIDDIPSYILEKIKHIDTLSIPYPYPITLNLTKLNLTKPNVDELEIENPKQLDFESAELVDVPQQDKHNFQEFRDLYDKKVDRGAVEKKWKKLKQKDIEAIFIHLPKYKQETLDKQFRKNPETYINNRSRENEVIISSGPDYENIDQFHKQYILDVQPIKEWFSKKYGEQRRDNYSKIKEQRRKSPLYLSY